MTKISLLGWIAFVAGCAIWLWGYLTIGHPPFIDWQSKTPWWIADYLPNREAELGLLLCIVSMIPMYWPTTKQT